MAPKRTLVIGCNGQLGRAVRALAEERGVAKDFDFCDIDTFDMSDPEAYSQVRLVALRHRDQLRRLHGRG